MSSFPPDSLAPTEPAPRPGMSTGTKVLIIVGIILGVCVLLCCGGLAISGCLLQRYVARSVSEDPETVRATTDELAQMEIPDQLAPKAVLDLKVPLSSERMMTMVFWSHEESGSVVLRLPGARGAPRRMLVARGLPAVTLGCGQQHPHTTSEQLDLNEFRRACAVAWYLASGGM